MIQNVNTKLEYIHFFLKHTFLGLLEKKQKLLILLGCNILQSAFQRRANGVARIVLSTPLDAFGNSAYACFSKLRRST